MPKTNLGFLLFFLTFAWVVPEAPNARAQAPARVELTVIYQQGGMLDKPQFWAERLGEAGINNVRLRLQHASDRPGIEVAGTPDRPVYRVTAVLDSQDRLVIENKRFSRGDVGRLAAWLNDLSRTRPSGESEEDAAGPFGLPKSQFDQITVDLSQPVGFSTLGKPRREVLEGLAKRTVYPVWLTPEVLKSAGDEEMKAELAELSVGTAISYTLRTFNMGFEPKLEPQDKYRYKIIPLSPNVKTWPVGWKAEKPNRELVPKMFEFLNANVEGVPISQVLDVVSKRLGTPFLFDPLSLKKHELNPETALVTSPSKRTSYAVLLRHVLFQAKMESELRVDDEGKPFFWITSWKR